jgi:hypothetical protein
MGEGEGIGDGLGFTGCDGEGKGVGGGVGVKVAGGDGVSVAVLEGVGLGVAVWRRQLHSSKIAVIAALSLQKSHKGRSEKQLIAGEPDCGRAWISPGAAEPQPKREGMSGQHEMWNQSAGFYLIDSDRSLEAPGKFTSKIKKSLDGKSSCSVW